MITEKFQSLVEAYASAYVEDEMIKCSEISHLIYDCLIATATEQIESEWDFYIVDWMRMRFELIESIKKDIGADVASYLVCDLRDNDAFRLGVDLSEDHIKRVLEVAVTAEEYEFAAYIREELQWGEWK
jgi:hypothetical protein